MTNGTFYVTAIHPAHALKNSFQAVLSLNDGGFLRSFPILNEAQTAWSTIYPDQPTPPAISQAREMAVDEAKSDQLASPSPFIASPTISSVSSLSSASSLTTATSYPQATQSRACLSESPTKPKPPKSAPLFKPAFPTKSVPLFKPAAPPRTPSPSKGMPSNKRPAKPSHGELPKPALATPLCASDPALGIASPQFRQFIKMTAKSIAKPAMPPAQQVDEAQPGPSDLPYEDTLNVEDEHDGEVAYWVVLRGKKPGIYKGWCVASLFT